MHSTSSNPSFDRQLSGTDLGGAPLNHSKKSSPGKKLEIAPTLLSSTNSHTNIITQQQVKNEAEKSLSVVSNAEKRPKSSIQLGRQKKPLKGERKTVKEIWDSTKQDRVDKSLKEMKNNVK